MKNTKKLLIVFSLCIVTLSMSLLVSANDSVNVHEVDEAGFTTIDVDNDAMSAKFLFDKGPFSTGSYKITLSDLIEKEPDQIKSGDTIKASFDTCENLDVTPNLESSKVLVDSQSGTILGEISISGNGFIFTFNDINNARLIEDGDMILAFDIEVLTQINSPNFDCNLNIDTNFSGSDGNRVVDSYTEDITFANKGVGGYDALVWNIDDTYANIGNVIKKSDSFNHRQNVFSAGYYDSIGGSDQRGGIIADGSTTVGQTIGINLNYSGGDDYVAIYDFEDLQSFSGSYTLAHETTLNPDYPLYVSMAPTTYSKANTQTYDVTDLLEDDDFTYDSETNTISFKMESEDIAEAEELYGYNLDSPEIYFSFAVDINYDEDSAIDNRVLGQPVDVYDYRFSYYTPGFPRYDASIPSKHELNNELDAIDGYANEGFASIKFIDINEERDAVARNFYQEEGAASGLVSEPYIPKTDVNVSDSDEERTTLNTIDLCTDNTDVTYEIDTSTTNLYLYYSDIGHFEVEIPDSVNYDLDDVKIINNKTGEELKIEPYWSVSIENNNLRIDVHPYNVEYKAELLYNTFTITIPATLDDSKSDFEVSSYWDINGTRYDSNSVNTTLKKCSNDDESDIPTAPDNSNNTDKDSNNEQVTEKEDTQNIIRETGNNYNLTFIVILCISIVIVLYYRRKTSK